MILLGRRVFERIKLTSCQITDGFNGRCLVRVGREVLRAAKLDSVKRLASLHLLCARVSA